MSKSITPHELKSLLRSDSLYALIDVRERNEYESGQIFGSTHIPRRLLETRVPVLIPIRDTKVVLYSNRTVRAGFAARTLEEGGYTNIYILEDGLNGWKNAGFPEVTGVHVLSKAFGEIVGELGQEATSIFPHKLKEKLEEYAVIDVRPAEEVSETGSIPGAVNIPGVELLLKIDDYFRAGKGVVLTCAGRTRGFISAATVKALGFDPVFDLHNGTLGWLLAGYQLEKEIPPGAPPSPESRKKADDLTGSFALKEGIPTISADRLDFLLQEADKKPLYVIDVRTQDEYERGGHIPGSIFYPGGQAIQNTDDVTVVKGATMVFVCDNGTRSAITAYWYRRMGIKNVFVLGQGIADWVRQGYPLEKGVPESLPLNFGRCLERTKLIDAASAHALLKSGRHTVILDVGTGHAFAAGHLPSAYWIPRGHLEKRIGAVAGDKSESVLVCSADPREAVFAAATLQEEGYSDVLVLDGGTAAWLGAGFGLESGADGSCLDDLRVRLEEYGKKEAAAYFEWEESLIHRESYMEYFKDRHII